MSTRTQLHLPGDLDEHVRSSLARWQRGGMSGRLWSKDSGVWTGADEARWLGWLTIPGEQRRQIERFHAIRTQIAEARFEHACLLGMGGSSLCGEVLRRTFGTFPGFPELSILDSTDPSQVGTVLERCRPEKSLFIVASKSGTTLEPNILKEFFWDRTVRALGLQEAGQHFLAITDPGSSLEKLAKEERFRAIYHGVPNIGGRFSALSDFGIVPAAIMGIDCERFLDSALEMVTLCGPEVAADENPGVLLGTVLGVAAGQGRDKVTLLASRSFESFGAWLEQLLAESTGKNGVGLIPVDGESVLPPDRYGNDRLFVSLRLQGDDDPALRDGIARLADAGQPVVGIEIEDRYRLGAEFFRWEIATAVAGSLLGINPFDQPDVEASKIETRRLTEAYEESGAFPSLKPFASEDGLTLYTDEANAEALRRSLDGREDVGSLIRSHLGRLQPGDYFALLAYVEMNREHEDSLRRIRMAVNRKKRVATSVGFGPRFLHSTGQAYKGGPNSGVFLQITCEEGADLSVPGRKLSFGVVKSAQARGDFDVLSSRGRRLLHVHLGEDVAAGLRRLEEMIGVGPA